MTTPNATYRVQLHREFPFAAAEQAVPHLARLGVSHLYVSPIYAARAGSMHGYDVIDYTVVNPELGGRPAFDSLVAALHRHGMGLLLDIVPNHMAAACPDNPWWTDVLRAGQASAHATTFDIDWSGGSAVGPGRILLPILAAPYNEVLEKGDLQLVLAADGRQFELAYFENRLPLSAPSQELLWRSVGPGGDARAWLQGRPAADAAGGATLPALLEMQHYRLAHWQTARDQINWRRFFEISDLVGVRVELPEVFEATHALVFELYRDGLIDGVRVDHIDGLADPAGYCRALQQRLAALRSVDGERGAWIVVEKILARGEQLPDTWPISGTTGYDFMNDVLRLFMHPAGERPLSEVWRAVCNDDAPFEQYEYVARRQILEANLGAEFARCLAALVAVARSTAPDGDLTEAALGRALNALVVGMRVYRTYIGAAGAAPADRAALDGARGRALERLDRADIRALDALLEWLTMPSAEDDGTSLRLRARTRFQQLCAPVAAKAVEDTAFYRYVRMIALNEVGGAPAEFALSAADFHALTGRRAVAAPLGLLATATHDHKRGEDTRARLAVLSEIPDEWLRTVSGWLGATTQLGEDGPAPDDAYAFFQTLVGAWPPDLAPDDAAGLDLFMRRVGAWQLKAVREAKQRSSWLAPDEGYEARLARLAERFAAAALAGCTPTDVARFVASIEAAGIVNSLAQLLIRLTAPGVPDQYQGTEFWDFSLVDPDNRTPVDYARRLAALGADDAPARLLAGWRDGRVKQRLLAQCLRVRREHAALFRHGDYQGLTILGDAADSVIAFERVLGKSRCVTVVSRHVAGLVGTEPIVPAARWGDTAVLLPARPQAQHQQHPPSVWRDALCGTEHVAAAGEDGARLAVAQVLGTLPVALLVCAG